MLQFKMAIIELYGRRESSGKGALIKAYLAVVSVWRVEYITGALPMWRLCFSGSLLRQHEVSP
jgi:hypothetical protein